MSFLDMLLGLEPEQCSICGRVFESKKALTNHCVRCAKQYANGQRLRAERAIERIKDLAESRVNGYKQRISELSRVHEEELTQILRTVLSLENERLQIHDLVEVLDEVLGEKIENK